jgi:hypothetical protein
MQRSEDGGQSWREINNGILYKEAWCVVQHPHSAELFVGTGPSPFSRAKTAARVGSTANGSEICPKPSIGLSHDRPT